ncbi:hypothetical protein F2P81_005639 [Scophthalmus maximus]|uniref:Uncharacterized protein n=1 Tax=Scophthalmus maximus TaxID=52904 RepID=A0A6A4T751_SCOMX|nr:hypothetical protein F2P81_005639 [Scophthalmus maximus]
MDTLLKQFDDDVHQILEATAQGKAEVKLQAMTAIIVSISAERFLEKQKKVFLKEPKRCEDPQHQTADASIEDPGEEAGEDGHIGLAQLMCIPLQENQGPPLGRVASEMAAQKGPETCSLYHQPLQVHQGAARAKAQSETGLLAGSHRPNGLRAGEQPKPTRTS